MALIEFTEEEKNLLNKVINERAAYVDTIYKQEKRNKGQSKSQDERLQEIKSELSQRFSSFVGVNKALLIGIIREYLLNPNEERISFHKKNESILKPNPEEEQEKIYMNGLISLYNKISLKKERRSLIK
tara:strand:- start:18963 stop:19349 length:387 start_codon:yes stop_codon:yes gene_type:complete